MAETGTIPSSSALKEAGSGSDNLVELLSRNPESYSDEDLQQVIGAMRLQRERWEAAEKAQGGRVPKVPKVAVRSTTATTGDLGL